MVAPCTPRRTRGFLPDEEQSRRPQVQRPLTIPWTGNTLQPRSAYSRAASSTRSVHIVSSHGTRNRRDTDRVVSRALYVLAAAIVLAAIIYAATVDPRPCGMDDVATTCGSGARWGPLVGAIFVALILLYVGRAIKGTRRRNDHSASP